jgi:hypothetical protein
MFQLLVEFLFSIFNLQFRKSNERKEGRKKEGRKKERMRKQSNFVPRTTTRSLLETQINHSDTKKRS